MRSFLIITWIEFKLFLRNFYSPFFSIAFPIMMLLLFGTIYGNEPNPFFGGFGAMDVSVPAYMGIALGVNGLMTLPLILTEYRDKKILKRFRATPINPSTLFISQIVVNFIVTVLGIILLIVLGILLYDVGRPANIFPFLGAIVLGIFCMFSVGLLIASIMPSHKSAGIVANLLYFPMIFLSGATLPAQLFPKNLQTVTKVLPLTYAVNLIKATWLEESFSGHLLDVVVLGGIFIVFFTVSLLTFRWE